MVLRHYAKQTLDPYGTAQSPRTVRTVVSVYIITDTTFRRVIRGVLVAVAGPDYR